MKPGISSDEAASSHYCIKNKMHVRHQHKSTSVILRDYRPTDYEAVSKLFRKGILEGHKYYKKEFINGNPIMLAMQVAWFLFIFFVTGSVAYGLAFLTLFYTISIIYQYKVVQMYLELCYNQDMGDRDLKFWTTKPNRYILAVPESDPNIVLGMVAYMQKDDETIEFQRMSVCREARGMGLGRKLTEEVIKCAKSTGFANVYLQTTNGQFNALQMYQILGFVQISANPVPFYKNLWLFHGITLIEMINKIA